MQQAQAMRRHRQVQDDRLFRTPCKFHAQGNCRSGAACTFIHDAPPGQLLHAGAPPAGFGQLLHTDRLQNNVLLQAPILRPLLPQPQPLPERVSPLVLQALLPPTVIGVAQHEGLFRTPCKFHAQGNCRSGAACTFIHDAPIVGVGQLPHVGRLQHNDLLKPHIPQLLPSRPQLPQEWVSPLVSQAPLPASKFVSTTHALPPSASVFVGNGVPRTPCKFHALGKCRAGESCTFIHEALNPGRVAPTPRDAARPTPY